MSLPVASVWVRRRPEVVAAGSANRNVQRAGGRELAGPQRAVVLCESRPTKNLRPLGPSQQPCKTASTAAGWSRHGLEKAETSICNCAGPGCARHPWMMGLSSWETCPSPGFSLDFFHVHGKAKIDRVFKSPSPFDSCRFPLSGSDADEELSCSGPDVVGEGLPA